MGEAVTEKASFLEQLESFRLQRGLSRKGLAHALGVHQDTLGHWFSTAKSAQKPSANSLKKIQQFLADQAIQGVQIAQPQEEALKKEVERRSRKVKYLILLLEDELRWFRDGETKARELLRKELSFNDVGYISSLLGMLGDEQMFQRWRTFTTYQFKGFKGG